MYSSTFLLAFAPFVALSLIGASCKPDPCDEVGDGDFITPIYVMTSDVGGTIAATSASGPISTTIGQDAGASPCSATFGTIGNRTSWSPELNVTCHFPGEELVVEANAPDVRGLDAGSLPINATLERYSSETSDTNSDVPITMTIATAQGGIADGGAAVTNDFVRVVTFDFTTTAAAFGGTSLHLVATIKADDFSTASMCLPPQGITSFGYPSDADPEGSQ